MVNVRIDEITVYRLLDILQELREMGWVTGVDFDFAYHKPVYDNFSYDPVVRRHAMFTFYNESNASYFMLRWG